MNHGKSGWILKGGIWVCGIFALVCLVWGIVVWSEGAAVKDEKTLAQLGNLGSYLQGTVASLWALAGVFLLVLAFLGSQQQLALQREQLAAQERQLNEQLATIKKQSFEDSFFQLLELHNATVSHMLSNWPVQNGLGVKLYATPKNNFFEGFCNSYRSSFQASSPNVLQEQEHSPREFIAQHFLSFYKSYRGGLEQYFNNLYQLVKFVKTHDVPDQRRYMSLVRAQLCQFELALVFYYCLCPLGDKIKPSLEEFGFFEHLDTSLLAHQSHKGFYAEAAYH